MSAYNKAIWGALAGTLVTIIAIVLHDYLGVETPDSTKDWLSRLIEVALLALFGGGVTGVGVYLSPANKAKMILIGMLMGGAALMAPHEARAQSYSSLGSSYYSASYGSNGSSRGIRQFRPLRNLLGRARQRVRARINSFGCNGSRSFGSAGSTYYAGRYEYRTVFSSSTCPTCPTYTQKVVTVNSGSPCWLGQPANPVQQGSCPGGVCPAPEKTPMLCVPLWADPVQNCPDGLCPLPTRVNKSVPRKPGPNWTINDGRNVWNHLQAAHGVSSAGLSRQDAYNLHDNIHNGWL